MSEHLKGLKPFSPDPFPNDLSQVPQTGMNAPINATPSLNAEKTCSEQRLVQRPMAGQDTENSDSWGVILTQNICPICVRLGDHRGREARRQEDRTGCEKRAMSSNRDMALAMLKSAKPVLLTVGSGWERNSQDLSHLLKYHQIAVSGRRKGTVPSFVPTAEYPHYTLLGLYKHRF